MLGIFGYSRIAFPQNEEVVDAIMSALQERGAVNCGEGGMPTVTDEYYFSVRGRRIKVIVEDWGDIILWGPTGIVRELSSQVSDRLGASSPMTSE